MSLCGYYSCFKGVPKCSLPTDGYIRTKMFYPRMCDSCRKSCGGIYPSQLPKEDLRDKCEVVFDKR